MRILTDYLITKSQCPLWEEQTQNVDYIPYWGTGYSFLQNHLVKTLRLFWQRKNYDLIITGDFRGSQLFAILQWIFPWNKKPQLMLDFMLDEEKPGIVWKIKRIIQKKVLSRPECILVFSREELANYSKLLGIPEEKFRFVYYHTNIIHPCLISDHSGYVFAAGNAGRDFDILLKALDGTDIPMVIVTSPPKMAGLKVPSNAKVYYNIPYPEYLELLAGAQIVVVPLKTRVRSVGMVVMMEGMALGKPVITTKAASNQEYIEDGMNGFLVEPGDVKTLRERIEYLTINTSEAERIGKQALDDIKRNWTFDQYVTDVLKIANEVMKNANDTGI